MHDAHKPFRTTRREWALIDPNNDVFKPHHAFKAGVNFVVWATSPADERYRSWRKELLAPFYTLDNWTWAEALNVAVNAWGFALNDPRIRLMHAAFINYGPTVQICKEVALGSFGKFIEELQNEIQGITKASQISGNFMPAPRETHRWCLVYPSKDRFPMARVISDYVEDLLVARLMMLDASENYELYSLSDSFSEVSNLQDRIFEQVMHANLPDSRYTIFPMPRVDKEEHYVDLTGVSYRPFQNLDSLSRDVRQGVYWIPQARSLQGVHSLAIVKDAVYIFQVTRNVKQAISHTSLESIRDDLPLHLQSVDRWEFVWVVPHDKSYAFTNPYPIEDAGAATWHLHLRQFIMPVVVNSDLFYRAFLAR
ncbi:hypothetical protein BD410DRAFT_797645 [Rickenella mellea]|uniref:Uncharacterized protein n=1 Tax=Rickenella mellea TaxID=50990 RepID=A0A4Y7PG88_9AGAM|nr:hypothetical protein BD410DRAFT_797645 [Rickenella mellea]